MDSTNGVVMTTGPVKQGVKLLAEPLKIGLGICLTVIEAHLDSSSDCNCWLARGICCSRGTKRWISLGGIGEKGNG
ncbi:hypothetical protein HanHA300_Chr13g0503341 [Helianthus annuus]|nr:hypothetical protein HanHA300_Chr13g0503341 [Helianthus annuus]KAJ0499625.1 hypothetical protein HanHA89_Chr13g0536061 [Helianthus annuus]KAJ0665638.1 hypothetical protein HanLR1_Chr13g0506051 [Helianthus annuus]